MADYYTLLTAAGAAKVADAHVTGTPVQLTHIAVGDGLDGAAYEPSEDQAALKNEVWRAGINEIRTDTANPNWLIIEGVVPEADGGWFVREVGIFDADGDLFAIGKYPETYKPIVAEGAGKDLLIRMILVVSNTADVTLNIDPAIVLATRNYVDGAITRHDEDPDAHGGILSQGVILRDATFAEGVEDGDPVRWDPDNDCYGPAAASDCLGIANVTGSQVIAFGDTPAGLLTDLAPGTVYYLDAAGALTATPGTVRVGRAREAGILFVDIDSSGALSLTQGFRTFWFPAGGILANFTNGPEVILSEGSANLGMRYTLDFSAAVEEHAKFTLKMPKGWNGGPVRARFVWTAASGTGDVVWGLRAVGIASDDDIDAAFGAGGEVTDTLTAADKDRHTAWTGDIAIAGSPTEGTLASFDVYRLAAAEADTFDEDAKLVGVELGLTLDKGNDA